MVHDQHCFERDGRISPVTSVLGLISLTLLSACSSGGASSTAAVRDSAGIQIVENIDFAWQDGQGWQLSQAPLLDIGILDGDSMYQLYQVAGALKLDDGRIVVANAGSYELRFFDSTGEFLQATGRKGGGPGEFGGILWLQTYPGDSLIVYDWRNRRISFFDDEGNFGRSFQMQFLSKGGGFPIYTGVLADRSLMVAVQEFLMSGEMKTELRRDTVVYLRTDPDGALKDTLGSLPGGEVYTNVDEGRAVAGIRPFGRYPQQVVSGGGFYYGSSDSYEIDYYDLKGKLKRIIRRARPLLEITAEDIELYKQEQIEDADQEGASQMIERLMSTVPFPETMPPYSTFAIDFEDNLWVADYLRPGDEQPRWTVFNPAGQMLGVIETPERFTVHQIGSDFVLGSWADEMDVEHVQLYALVKDGA